MRAGQADEKRQGRHASRSPGFSPPVVALVLIVTLVVAAAGLVILGQGEKAAAETEAEEPEVEAADPFEGLPPEPPPEPRRERGERSRD